MSFTPAGLQRLTNRTAWEEDVRAVHATVRTAAEGGHMLGVAARTYRAWLRELGLRGKVGRHIDGVYHPSREAPGPVGPVGPAGNTSPPDEVKER